MKSKLERAVLELAMADYRRLVRLKWTADDVAGTPRKLFLACEALAKYEKRRAGHKRVPKP